MKTNPRDSETAAAALLALGAFIERTRGHRAWLAAIPIVLVNFVAFYGQFSYLNMHLAAPHGVRLVMAVALESIAVYLAWQAHLAQLADDSALRLRLGAYLVAAGIGALNYSHYCGPHWRPTATAVAFALCSVVSPWLWSIHSRRQSRDALRADKRIEGHAVRLGATRWVWHLYRCIQVMHAATWVGETDPAVAITLRSGHDENGRDDDATVAPSAAAEEPSPGQASKGRERPRPVPVRQARTTDLVAASEHEHQVYLNLLSGGKLPSIRVLARDEFAGSIRAADRVLKLARAAQNGGGRHDDAS